MYQWNTSQKMYKYFLINLFQVKSWYVSFVFLISFWGCLWWRRWRPFQCRLLCECDHFSTYLKLSWEFFFFLIYESSHSKKNQNSKGDVRFGMGRKKKQKPIKCIEIRINQKLSILKLEIDWNENPLKWLI